MGSRADDVDLDTFTREVRAGVKAFNEKAALNATRLDEINARLQEAEQKLDRRAAPGNMDSGDWLGNPSNHIKAELGADGSLLPALRDGRVKAAGFKIGSFMQGGPRAALTNTDFPYRHTRDAEIYGQMPARVTVLDLIPRRPAQSRTVEFVTSTRSGGAAPQHDGSESPPLVEGAEKAETQLDFDLQTAKIITIATYLAASRQVLDDTEELADFIDGELRDELLLTTESQVMTGTGVGENIEGLMMVATPLGVVPTGTGPNAMLRRAITKVQVARGVPSGIVVHPVGLEELELEEDNEGRFLASYVVAADGRTIAWRVPVVLSNAIGQDDFLVGDFQRAARIWDRQDATVQVALQHKDFFTRNLVAILAEQRIGMSVPRPNLLIKGTF